MTARYSAPGELRPYSDRKLESGLDPAPWPIEDIVQAQCMACDGKTIDEIAAEMQLPHDEVRRVVYPDVETETKRQEVASVGFSNLKRGFKI